jgi:putative membrane protein insertion efficiency factor
MLRSESCGRRRFRGPLPLVAVGVARTVSDVGRDLITRSELTKQGSVDPAATWAVRVLRLVLAGYGVAVSPFLGPCCRFAPSCSAYASEAVGRFGIVRGGWMAVKRLLRCHPFHPGGWDPVV